MGTAKSETCKDPGFLQVFLYFRVQYAYVLTEKETQVVTLVMLFHKRLCGPLANYYMAPKHNELLMNLDDFIEDLTLSQDDELNGLITELPDIL